MSDPQKLIAAYLDDALTDAERDELVAWLKTHPDEMRSFVEANLFEQQIRQAVHGQIQREAAMGLVESESLPQPTPRRIEEENQLTWIQRLWLRLLSGGATGRTVAMTTCILALAVGLAFWLKRPAPRETTSAAVAMLARVVDARWKPGAEPLQVGSALEPGWLRLDSGLAQVDFYSGARLVIEGPAELQLLSPNEAACSAGRLLAEVPQPARGFRLKTDQLTVVDLGTSFGVSANPGRTEVHVFKGKVEVLSETAAIQSLNEGQAVMAQSGKPPRIMTANTAMFAALFELQKRLQASEAIRYEQWRIASARLNNDPSLVVHLDLDDLNSADWKLRNVAENNGYVQDATIVGCKRSDGRWHEKQALGFQSVNDRVRFVVPGEFESLTLAAWVQVMGLDRQFNSLFMCDGFEPGGVHWLIRNDGVLGLTVFGHGPGNYQILTSPPVLTLDKFGMWLHLAVVLDGKNRQIIHYVNGARVSRRVLSIISPFRLGPVELGNWNARSGPNPAPALIRNLSGALDEFELFSRSLSDEEIHELYVIGKPDE